MIKNLPKIAYNFSVQGESQNREIVLPDLMIRFDIKHIVKRNIDDVLEDYYMVDGDTLELVSLNLYGTMDYNWTIPLVNKRFDYIADYPMNSNHIDNYVAEKYGIDNMFAVHHYEDELGNIVDENYYIYTNDVQMPTGELAEQPIWRTSVQSGESVVMLKRGVGRPISNHEHESRLNDDKRFIKVVSPSYITEFIKLFNKAMAEIV